MLKTYIGVDAGKFGGIVTISTNGSITKKVMPLIGDQLDVLELSKYFSSIKESSDQVFAGIEDLKAIFGSAAGATFTFGFVCGATEALLIAHGIPFVKIQSKVWQKEEFIGIPEIRRPSSTNAKGVLKQGSLETKKMALLAQKRLFPDFDPTPTERSKKAHDGIVDGLLIAHYISKHF